MTRPAIKPAKLLGLAFLVVILSACGASGTASEGSSGSQTQADSSSGLALPTVTPETARIIAPTATAGTSVGASPTAEAASTQQNSGERAAASTLGQGAETSLQTVKFYVPTITCPSCSARVEANAGQIPGVVDAKADLDTQMATVTYDPAKTDPEKIAQGIREGGDTVQQVANE